MIKIKRLKKEIREKVTVFDAIWAPLADEVFRWQDKVLIPYCLSSCNKGCCEEMEHSGLSDAQVRVIFKLSKDDSLYRLKNRYGESIIKKEKDNTFSTRMCYGITCPALNNKKLCDIYDSKLKPGYCATFPFYFTQIGNQRILEIAGNCFGVKVLDNESIKNIAIKQDIIVRYLE